MNKHTCTPSRRARNPQSPPWFCPQFLSHSWQHPTSRCVRQRRQLCSRDPRLSCQCFAWTHRPFWRHHACLLRLKLNLKIIFWKRIHFGISLLPKDSLSLSVNPESWSLTPLDVSLSIFLNFRRASWMASDFSRFSASSRNFLRLSCISLLLPYSLLMLEIMLPKKLGRFGGSGWLLKWATDNDWQALGLCKVCDGSRNKFDCWCSRLCRIRGLLCEVATDERVAAPFCIWMDLTANEAERCVSLNIVNHKKCL